MWIAHSRVYVQSGIQSGIYHDLYIRRVESVSTGVRCPSQSVYISSVGRISHVRIQCTIRCLL